MHINEKWQMDSITASNEEFNSKKLYSFSENSYLSLSIEFLNYNGQINSYLNVFSNKIPSSIYPDKAQVQIVIDNIRYQFYEKLLLGHQKISLCESTSNLIIKALLENKSVEIVLDGFSNTISPEDFLKNYKKLNQKNNIFDKLISSLNL